MSAAPTPPRWRRSLGARLAAGYAAFFLLSTAALFALAYALLADSLRDRDRSAVLAEGGEIEGVARGGAAEVAVEVARALGEIEREPGVPPLAVRLVDAAGTTLVLAPAGRWAPYDLRALADVGVGEWATLPSQDGGAPMDVTAVPTRGGRTFHVGALAARESVLDRFRDLFLLIVLPVVVLGVGGGLVLARRALAPVRALAATVQRVNETGRLGERVPVRGSGDELDELGGLVNGMLGRIEALVAGMRATLDDAAHDLRTPLTRLRAGAERALLVGPHAHGEALSDAVEETDAVLAVLDAVMDVAEAEAGTLALHLVPADLARLTDEVVDLYGLIAEEKGVGLGWARPAPVVVRADPARVRQAVANLVDNAVKYTPPGGHVRVEVGVEGGLAVVRVADDGPGVPPADRPRIWDRLFRGDRSRSERGLGLGLSVVRAVAEAHGGAAAHEDAPGGGSRFTLRLPPGGPGDSGLSKL